MKKNFLLHIALSVLLYGSFTSCKKTEEVSLIGEGDERIYNTWEMKSYLRNDIDETSLIYIKNYTEKYTAKGAIVRSSTQDDGSSLSYIGTYDFMNDNKEIKLLVASCLTNFSAEYKTLSPSKYYILKLTDDEYWYYFNYGGDKHEFRFAN